MDARKGQLRLTVDAVGLSDPGWRAFVHDHPDATCFHRPEWAQLLARCYRYPGVVVVQREPDGAIVAGMPVLEVRQLSRKRRWVCLPFSDECRPLLGVGSSYADLLAGADRFRREAGADHLEVRGPAVGTGWTSAPVGVVHAQQLDPDPDAVLARMNSSARRNVRKAQRSGVTIRQGATLADAELFYALHVRTRQRKGVPVQPRRYFHLLWETMIDPGHGLLLQAEHEGRTIAGAMFLTGGRTFTYKYGASDPVHWGLSPNNLVLWQAMCWAAERGYAVFDWGRSDLVDDGLRRFKSGLGGHERPLVYARNPPGSSRGDGGAAEALRPVLRRSPAWACRAVGELLYRYVG